MPGNGVQRRRLAQLLLATPVVAVGCSASTAARRATGQAGFTYSPGVTSHEVLLVPRDRPVVVAFAINPGVQVIDVAGPWETFQDTYSSPDAQEPAFNMFTVSESVSPIRTSGGLSVVPTFTVDNAPAPDVIVVPHFDVPKPSTHEVSAIHEWIKDAHKRAALTMSVCTGAFQLAKTGLLDGLPVTTNQRAYGSFARAFPKADLRRGPRFVETGRIATSGGLSAGIDLALRVVLRSYGDDVAQQTANTMEYVGTGWQT